MEVRISRLLAVLLALGLSAAPAEAGDPLDELDGTEGWDQVVQPVQQQPRTEPDQDAFRREIAAWEMIRVMWEREREGYLKERATHKSLASRMRAASSPTTTEINDDNLDRATSGDGDWGDSPGEQWLVPSGSVDRLIDDELSESRPAARPAPPPAPPPAPLMPPPDFGPERVPSAFKQHERKDLGGGLAPTAPNPEAPLPPAAPEPAAEKKAADDGAKAAAEMLRRQQEEERSRETGKKARQEREAAEGAAAAAKLLEMQAEQERKEQEALRKKADLKVDEDGQVVDPELRREMEDEEEDEEE